MALSRWAFYQPCLSALKASLRPTRSVIYSSAEKTSPPSCNSVYTHVIKVNEKQPDGFFPSFTLMYVFVRTFTRFSPACSATRSCAATFQAVNARITSSSSSSSCIVALFKAGTGEWGTAQSLFHVHAAQLVFEVFLNIEDAEGLNCYKMCWSFLT